jgi:hypothetical protein
MYLLPIGNKSFVLAFSASLQRKTKLYHGGDYDTQLRNQKAI